MKQELLDNLYKDFPKLFVSPSKHKSLAQLYTMVSVNDGWYFLIHDLCSILANHIDFRIPEELQSQIYVTQIKEKFGALRFYTSHSDDYIDGAISMAEISSSCICELCGFPGKPGSVRGWVQTLCDKDFKKKLKASNQKEKNLKKTLKV